MIKKLLICLFVLISLYPFQIIDAQEKQGPEPEFFIRAEINPTYKYGEDAWNRFLAKNLNNDEPFVKGAPKNTYRVVIEFMIDTAGTLTDFKQLTNFGFGMEEEAIRIIKAGGPWNPAIQNGVKVRFLQKQLVVFSPENVYKDYAKKYPEAKYDSTAPNIFTRVEVDASYPGGAPAWRNFLATNLRGATPERNGAKPGVYIVVVQFVIDKDGTLSDIKPLTFEGYGMEEEVIRVLKKSGKWNPAMLNGEPVKGYRKQPVTFEVVKPRKRKK